MTTTANRLRLVKQARSVHTKLADLLRCMSPELCRFSDAGNDGAIDALGRPASEKRQGRKSRSVVQRRCGVRYGDLAAGLGLKRSNRSGCGGWFGADRG